jgi:hypothetical protein
MGSTSASRVWDQIISLRVVGMHFGQAEAGLVPAGITWLTLWWVQDVSLRLLYFPRQVKFAFDLGKANLLFACVAFCSKALKLGCTAEALSNQKFMPNCVSCDLHVLPASFILLQRVRAQSRQLGTFCPAVQLA